MEDGKSLGLAVVGAIEGRWDIAGASDGSNVGLTVEGDAEGASDASGVCSSEGKSDGCVEVNGAVGTLVETQEELDVGLSVSNGKYHSSMGAVVVTSFSGCSTSSIA